MSEVNLSFVIPLMLIISIALADIAREVQIRELSVEVPDNLYLLHAGPFEPLFRPLSRLLMIPGEKLADLLSWGGGLQRLLGRDHQSIVEEPDHDSNTTPSFGRFNHLHGFNSVILASTLVLIAIVRSDLTGVLLSFIVTIFWMNLPALETNEYDNMQKTFEPGEPLYSFSFHTFAVAILSIGPIILSFAEIRSIEMPVKVVGFSLFILSAVLVGNLYLSFLDNELQRLAQCEDNEQK